jgi:hypothetical protein
MRAVSGPSKAARKGTWWSAAIVAALSLHMAAMALLISSLGSVLQCERGGECTQTERVLGWKINHVFQASDLVDVRVSSEISPRRSGERSVYFVELKRRDADSISLLPKTDLRHDRELNETLRRARAFIDGGAGSFRHEKGFGGFEAAVLVFGLAFTGLGSHYARTAVRRARRPGVAA